MKSFIGKISLGVVFLVMVVLGSACLVSPQQAQPEGNQPPVISSLEAEYINVYPRGGSEIRCAASDPEGDVVQFSWSCTAGNITGDGATVTWEAPSDYGDYHIMVIVTDKNGGSTKEVLTISVVPRSLKKSCCG